MATVADRRQQLARGNDEYWTAWFADVRNNRAHACSCPDYFNRNIVTGNPEHVCKHLKTIAPVALATAKRLGITLPFNILKTLSNENQANPT